MNRLPSRINRSFQFDVFIIIWEEDILIRHPNIGRNRSLFHTPMSTILLSYFCVSQFTSFWHFLDAYSLYHTLNRPHWHLYRRWWVRKKRIFLILREQMRFFPPFLFWIYSYYLINLLNVSLACNKIPLSSLFVLILISWIFVLYLIFLRYSSTDKQIRLLLTQMILRIFNS